MLKSKLGMSGRCQDASGCQSPSLHSRKGALQLEPATEAAMGSPRAKQSLWLRGLPGTSQSAARARPSSASPRSPAGNGGATASHSLCKDPALAVASTSPELVHPEPGTMAQCMADTDSWSPGALAAALLLLPAVQLKSLRKSAGEALS